MKPRFHAVALLVAFTYPSSHLLYAQAPPRVDNAIPMEVRVLPDRDGCQIALPAEASRKLSQWLNDNVDEEKLASLVSTFVDVAGNVISTPDSDAAEFGFQILVELAKNNTSRFKERLENSLGDHGVIITVKKSTYVYIARAYLSKGGRNELVRKLQSKAIRKVLPQNLKEDVLKVLHNERPNPDTFEDAILLEATKKQKSFLGKLLGAAVDGYVEGKQSSRQQQRKQSLEQLLKHTHREAFFVETEWSITRRQAPRETRQNKAVNRSTQKRGN